MSEYVKIICPSCGGRGKTFMTSCGHCLGYGEIDDITQPIASMTGSEDIYITIPTKPQSGSKGDK